MNESLKSVVKSSTNGKDEKSSGLSAYNDTSKIIILKDTLTVRKKSNKIDGIGIIIITSINITPSAKAISVCFAIFFIMEDAVTFVSAAIFILKIFNYGYSIYIIKIIISIPF